MPNPPPAPESQPPLPGGLPLSIRYSECDTTQGETFTSAGTIVSLRPCDAVRDTQGCVYRYAGHSERGNQGTITGIADYNVACFDVTGSNGQTIREALCIGPQDQKMGPSYTLECQSTLEVLKATSLARHALVSIPLKAQTAAPGISEPSISNVPDHQTPPESSFPATPAQESEPNSAPPSEPRQRAIPPREPAPSR